MPNWVDVFRSGALERCGKQCDNLQKLASAISEEIDESVNANALDAAFRRHRNKLKLKQSLMDYVQQAAGKKLPIIKPKDLKFRLGDKQANAMKKSKRLVITSAMNNCKIDGKVWASLRNYATHNNAEILVLPIRYKNPTSLGETKSQDEDAWWASEILSYLSDDVIELHEHLWVMGNVPIEATAVHPLTGLETVSGDKSAIFGHSQLAMKMVPTPQNKLPKVMYTTGAVTEPKYSASKAGIRGNSHHSMGGLVVELDGPRFHIRALSADDQGGFYDLDKYYSHKGVENSTGALALVTGDEHVVFVDPKCKEGTYTNKDSIVNITKPKVIVRHDVFDGYSVSHHNRKDPVVQMAKHASGLHKVEDELKLTIDHIDETTPKGVKNIIVSSNHHNHLLRWLKEVTPLDEPWNADLLIDLWVSLKSTISMGPGGAEHGDPFALWSLPRLKSDTEFLAPDDERAIAGIAIGMHGHRGANGAKGSLTQFSKLGIRSITGHGHSPGICHGAFRVGTSSNLRLEYTGGASSWAHCHCLIHPNGKRQLVFIVDGHWRLSI